MFIISYIFLLALSHIRAEERCKPSIYSIVNQSIEIYEAQYNKYTKRSHLESPEPLLHQSTSVQDLLEKIECGVSARDPDHMIIGGGPAPEKVFPWQVGFLSPRGYCGGVLISNSWALTAAHCSVGINSTGVLGSLIFDDRTFQPNKQIRRVKVAVMHEHYSCKPINNDIALVKFESPLVLNDFVRPICLPKKGGDFDGVDSCFVSGWGYISQSPGPRPPLQFGRTSVMPESICFYSIRLFGRILKSSCFCGDVAGAFAAPGDSGGAFSCKVGGRYYAVGLSSYILTLSGTDIVFFRNIFTKVSEFKYWILKTIEEHGL